MRPVWSGLTKGTPSPVVCGRKFCSRCGRWRLVALDFELIRPTATRPQRRFRSYCRTCQRLSNRDSTRRLVTDPQRLTLRREYQRIWAEAKRREAGVPQRVYNDTPSNPRRRRTVIDTVERVLLPAAPLVAKLEALSDEQLTTLAGRAGVNPRALYRYRYGESARVRIDVGDRLAVALGITSSLLWGEQW